MEGLMKGIFNITLALTGQFAVWDPDIILDYLINLEYDLPLKDLSEKLAILLCLLSEQRYGAVKTLNIKDIVLEKGKCIFFIKKPMKTINPDFYRSPIAFSE